MSATILLDPNWLSYIEYKLSRGQNPDIFIPGDNYESDFLSKLILTHYPQYTEPAIELSINHIKRTIYAGCNRSLFIEMVVNHLLQRQPLVAIP